MRALRIHSLLHVVASII